VCHIPRSWWEHLRLIPEHPRKPHNMSRAYRLPKSLRVTLTASTLCQQKRKLHASGIDSRDHLAFCRKVNTRD
jgi:hypothetical protein